MGLLDFEKTYKPLYVPPSKRKHLSEEERQTQLNNYGRGQVTKDFADSPHADRI